MKKGIEVWIDYDSQLIWTLHIKKARGKLTLEEIRETCMEYEQDFYMLVICAMDREIGQYYDTDDLEGDYVTLYRADDFFQMERKSMTREELIAHLEHLAEYVKYSEDAPALREVVEMLRCSEMPNSSKDFFWKNARKNARKYTETHACDLPQSTMGQVNDTAQSTNDCISRQAAIDELTEYGSGNDIYMSVGELKRRIEALPPAQPDVPDTNV